MVLKLVHDMIIINLVNYVINYDRIYTVIHTYRTLWQNWYSSANKRYFRAKI